MLIRYNITMDDLVAFNLYHFTRSPFIKGINYGVMIVVAMLIVLGFSFASISSGEPIAAILGVIFAALFCVIYQWMWPASLDWHVRRLLSEGHTKGMLGPHELEIDPQGIIERTDMNESRTAWRGVDRIVETEDYAFIYISAIMAHVIPKHATTTDDPTAFIARARAWWRAANPEAISEQEKVE